MSRNDAQLLDTYLRDVRRTTLLDRQQEEALALRWRDHRDQAAADELVQRNLRFVVQVALSYRRYGLPLDDLVQEGNLGLIRAVEKYDPSRGTRLISYAVWWIRAYIQSYVLQSWSLVRVGTTRAQRRLFHQLPRALAKLEGAPGDRVAALAEQLGARAEDVERVMAALQRRDLSLETPVGVDGDLTVADRIADDGDDPETATADAEAGAVRSRTLRACLDRLPPRERAIVELRFGEDGRTLRDVGDELGLSRERVRQLETLALRRLGAMLRSEERRHDVA